MNHGNYAAWHADVAAFDGLEPDQRAAFLVKFAVLAPSSHNSQPWRFSVQPSEILVQPEPSRTLPVSDPTSRQLQLSLGAATENICQAADYFGLTTQVEAVGSGPETSWKISLSGSPRPADSRDQGHLATVIGQRHTDRRPYDDRPPSAEFVARMSDLAGPTRVTVIDREPLKRKVALMVSDGLIEAMDSKSFRQELSHYVLPNVTRRNVGMPMSGFGMPTPPSFLAPRLVRLFNVNRLRRKADEDILTKQTRAFVVLSTAGDAAPDWLDAGRAFQRIALAAAREGLSVAPLAAAIEIGDRPERLRALLGNPGRPQMFFRLGYAAGQPPVSPRLPAEAVTTA